MRVIDRDRTDHSDFDKIVGFPDWCCANAAFDIAPDGSSRQA